MFLFCSVDTVQKGEWILAHPTTVLSFRHSEGSPWLLESILSHFVHLRPQSQKPPVIQGSSGGQCWWVQMDPNHPVEYEDTNWCLLPTVRDLHLEASRFAS